MYFWHTHASRRFPGRETSTGFPRREGSLPPKTPSTAVQWKMGRVESAAALEIERQQRSLIVEGPCIQACYAVGFGKCWQSIWSMGTWCQVSMTSEGASFRLASLTKTARPDKPITSCYSSLPDTSLPEHHPDQILQPLEYEASVLLTLHEAQMSAIASSESPLLWRELRTQSKWLTANGPE